MLCPCSEGRFMLIFWGTFMSMVWEPFLSVFWESLLSLFYETFSWRGSETWFMSLFWYTCRCSQYYCMSRFCVTFMLAFSERFMSLFWLIPSDKLETFQVSVLGNLSMFWKTFSCRHSVSPFCPCLRDFLCRCSGNKILSQCWKTTSCRYSGSIFYVDVLGNYYVDVLKWLCQCSVHHFR